MRIGKLNQRLVPALLVNDLPETLAFYRKLGFEVTGYHPNRQDATWDVMVSRSSFILSRHVEHRGNLAAAGHSTCTQIASLR